MDKVLVVGLGNPGNKYQQTRHNVGFMVLERLSAILDIRNWKLERKFGAEIANGRNIMTMNREVILVKPLTFMNLGGQAVKKVLSLFGKSLFVVHDDLDFLQGRLKIQRGGGAAGHHGVESIIVHLGTSDFVRFRVGVQTPYCKIATPQQAKDYLLSDFTQEEWQVMEPMLQKTAEAVVYSVKYGVEKGMNKYNEKVKRQRSKYKAKHNSK